MSPRRDVTVAGVFRSFFPTRFGCGAVVASAAGVMEVFLPFSGLCRERSGEEVLARYPDANSENDLTVAAATLLERYFAGERVEFSLPLDCGDLSPFREMVFRVVAAIPYGETRSYRQVAEAAGSPGASRAVGGAMAANRMPILIPCHRVLGSGGCLTGFSAPGGVEAKQWLLALEKGETGGSGTGN